MNVEVLVGYHTFFPRLSHLFSSAFPFSPETDPKGKGNEAQIMPERTLADIQAIVAELPVWIRILGDVDSGQSGKARPDTQSLTEAWDIFIWNPCPVSALDAFSHSQRSGADKTHLSCEDIHELWEFIQSGRPQDMTHTSDSTIILLRLPDPELTICPGNHRAKFIQPETGAVSSPTLLPVKDGAPVFQSDCKRNREKHRQGNEQHKSRKNNIKGPLQQRLLVRR